MAIFKSVKALKPKRHFFDLSNEYKFTCDMGQLIPVYLEECYPGDKFKISNEIIVRMQPLTAPVMHAITAYTEYFFVPMRLLWSDWESFITGGEDGNDSHTIPRWTTYLGAYPPMLGSLWDYFCLPLVTMTSEEQCPIALPKYAYNLVWNEYYRDENIDDEIDITQNDSILYRRWSKDYFTSALPFPQRGTSPALPVSGQLPVTGNISAPVVYSSAPWERQGFDDMVFNTYIQNPNGKASMNDLGPGSTTSTGNIYNLSHGYYQSGSMNGDREFTNFMDNEVRDGLVHRESDNTVNFYGKFAVDNPGSYDSYTHLSADASGATTFNISDLRLAFQIQKWMERNARAGVRYPEFLLAHFGVAPNDARLQRPEYLGGSRSSIIVSEVLQTSQTTRGEGGSPQGNLAGRGIGASSSYIASYSVPEPGYIVGLFSIKPKLAYDSQGMNKKWLRSSRYDFYSPEFAHLSEQPIKKMELYYDSTSVAKNNATFGYQGIYDELRHNRDKVSSYFRSGVSPSLDYWHLARHFNTSPELDSDFLECNPSKRIFEVEDENGFLVTFGNVIKAVRPIPKYAEPGLIDHF